MGMNTILMLIAGIVMSTMIASQVAPSIVEGVKVKKVQTQTINNQEVIFEAIKRYVTIKQVAPTTMEQLISAGYIDAKVNNNGFGVEHIIDSEKYTFSVSTTTGVATITTTIVDPKAQEAFLNSFMGTSKPTRIDETKFETKYVLPNEVMHGNALLMTGIPIQATPPDSNINKYWYDTSSGKATLKLYDGTSWVEVNLGGGFNKKTSPLASRIKITPKINNKLNTEKNNTGGPIILNIQGSMSGTMSGIKPNGCFAVYIKEENQSSWKMLNHYESQSFNVVEIIPKGAEYSFNTGCFTTINSVSSWYHIPLI